MRRLTLTLSIAVLSLGFASISMAQDAGPTGGMPPVQVVNKKPGRFVIERQILAKLNLSRDQVKQVRALIKETQAKEKALRVEAQATLDKQDLKAKRKAIFEGYETGLGTILSADQMTQYKALHKEYAAKEKAGVIVKGSGTPPPQN